MPSQPDSAKCDWLGWSLQFFFGLALGAFMAFGSVTDRRHSTPSWLAPEHVWSFVTGAALLLGGLASLFGEQMWWQFTDQRMPVQSHDNSKTSRRLSVLAIAAGIALMISAVFRNFVG